jgi:outer membrane protein assembly factor BamB
VGGLVFSGTPDQNFYALDARIGKVLWQHRMTPGVVGQPTTYRVDGKQYIAVQSGWGGAAPFWGGKHMTPMFGGIPLGGRLYAFALPDRAALDERRRTLGRRERCSVDRSPGARGGAATPSGARSSSVVHRRSSLLRPLCLH